MLCPGVNEGPNNLFRPVQSQVNLSVTAGQALLQMQTKQYAADGHQTGFANIALIGIDFCGTAVKIVSQYV